MNRKKTAKILMAMFIFTTLIVCGTLFFVNATNNGVEMRNEYLNVRAQHVDGEYGFNRFALFDARNEKTADIESELMYSRFYSSFTTININGKEYVYGTGECVTKPYYDSKDDSIISCESFDGIKVTQKLTFAEGYSTAKDMLKVEYSVDNQSEQKANIGIRIMVDPMLYDDDNAMINVNDKIITYETEFNDEIVPGEWSIENSENNITVYGLTECNNTPDSVQFVNWNNVYEDIWDYKTTSHELNDCAITFRWNSVEISSNQNIKFSTRYGFKSEATDSDVPETTSPESSVATDSDVSEPEDSDALDTSDVTPIAIVVIAVLSLSFIFALSYMKKGCEE